jgi:uncharacterized repeat protein (TIGR03803 family)
MLNQFRRAILRDSYLILTEIICIFVRIVKLSGGRVRKNIVTGVLCLAIAFTANSQGLISLYGVAAVGGANANGTLFQLCENVAGTPGTWTFSDLHDFATATDGQSPQSTLIFASNGLLYGQSYSGGGAPWDGFIFNYNWAVTGYSNLIHNTAYTANCYLMQPVSGGKLFGMTASGGASFDGNIFSYDYGANTITNIHTFIGEPNDGASPQYGTLFWYRDTLYGLTEEGGNKTGACGTCSYGVLFSLDTNATRYRILYNFAYAGAANTGSEPVGTVVEAANGTGHPCLYGACYYGGANTSKGCVFEYDLTTYSYSDIYDFKGSVSNDGSAPTAGLILATDGNLYGTASTGGSSNDGIIYKISPTTHAYSIVHTFIGGATDGVTPFGGLLQASDGNLYGLCEFGGTAAGIIYQCTLGGTFNVIYNFLTAAGNGGYEPLYCTLVANNTAICGGLPITLEKFNVECRNDQAVLTWTSGTETNNSHYTIDRTEDGFTYTNVAIVKGVGNSSTSTNYSYIDITPLPGTSYYRLSQTDYDGTTVRLKTATYQSCENATNIYVSVKNGEITVEITSPDNGEYTMALSNILGQEIMNTNYNVTSGLNTFTIHPQVANAIYIIQITGKQKVYTRKLLLGNFLTH